MTLPRPERTGREVHGVLIYPLTRGQAIVLQAAAKVEIPSEEEVERLAVQLATGATAEEVQSYYEEAPSVVWEAIVGAVLADAGMTADAGNGLSGG